MINLKFLDLAPKNKNQILITRKKTIYALIVLLAVFCVFKISKAGELQKESLKHQAVIVMSKIKEYAPQTLDEAFTKQPFCGWQLLKGTGESFYSPDFKETSVGNTIIENDFQQDGIDHVFSVCFATFNAIDSSVNRQIIFIVALVGIIIALIQTSKIDRKDEQNESEKKVSNS